MCTYGAHKKTRASLEISEKECRYSIYGIFHNGKYEIYTTQNVVYRTADKKVFSCMYLMVYFAFK